MRTNGNGEEGSGNKVMRGGGFGGSGAGSRSGGGSGSRAAAAAATGTTTIEFSGTEARGGGGFGGGHGGDTRSCSGGGWSPSLIFLEQLLESEFTPFFLQMTARVCWGGGVSSPLIEPIMGREGKEPT